jgi:uncharacterized protein (TIGR02145 family)
MKTNKLNVFFLLLCFTLLPACKKVEKEMLVTTGTVSNILTTIADVSGEILDLGEGATEYGHCYSTSPNTNISGTKTEYSSPVIGGFTSALTGLTPGTKYYIKAYLSRGSAVVYGSEINFTTASADLPELTTTAVTGITKTEAVSGGNITSQGGTPVTARGVCWSTATITALTANKTTNGPGTGSFTSEISGLTAGTAYYVRAYATNSGGTKLGNEVTFSTTPDALVPPTVTTASVTGITSNSAVCGGEVTNEGSTSVTAKGVCYSTTANPTILNTTTNNGTGAGSFVSNLSSLTPGTTYYIRAYATSSAGTGYGTETSFATSAVAPTLNTLPVTGITTTNASSGGDIISTGGTTITIKGVCWSLTSPPKTSDFYSTDGSATGPGTYSSTLINLIPGSTYYVRAYATNGIGTSYGGELSFSTNCTLPSAATNPASGITNTTSTFNGTVNANNLSTSMTFEYGLSTTYGTSVNATPGTVTGTISTSVTAAVSSLLPNTLYHYRVKTVNCGGTVNGNDQTFTTLCTAPVITTSAASSIGTVSAILNGNVNANNFSSDVAFEYGKTIAYGTSLTGSPSPVTGTSGTAVSVTATGLEPGTLYHYRVYATSCGGTVYGNDQTFTTICLTPTVTTGAITALGTTTATVNGTVNANGFSTDVIFEYGTTTAYGSSKSATPATVTGSTGTAVSAALTGLATNTLYHYRVSATNCGGTVTGNDNTFRTAPLTITDVDGNIYNVIVIGTQVWMKENLKTTKYRNNTSISNVTVNATWAALTTAAYCWYTNDAATYKNTYGAMYNWYALNSGDLCPTGWHESTQAEWTALASYLGGATVAGGKLKETGTTHWTFNVGATNETGFTALPAGYRAAGSGVFSSLGTYAGWWTPDQATATNSYFWSIYADAANANNYAEVKTGGQSVRCVRD